MPTTYNLSATLISSLRSVAGLRIEAWDAEGICPDLIDVAVADARGNFEMRIDRDYIADLLPCRRPALVFRVFDGDRLIQGAQRVWPLNAQMTAQQIPLTDSSGDGVDSKMRPAQLVVRGTASNVDGKPLAGRTVHAFDRNLERSGFKDTELGQSRTDSDGRYEIRYNMPVGGKVKPDLIVRLDSVSTGTTDASQTKFESLLIPAAPATARVNLGPARRPKPRVSEYQQIVAQLTPILKRGGVDFIDLDVEGARYLSSTARLAENRVRLVQQARALEREVGGAVPAEIFYGLLRTGFRGTFPELANEPLGQHRRRLERAIQRNVIARSFASSLTATLSTLERLLVARVTSGTATGSGSNKIAAVLATSLSSSETQAAFLARWLNRSERTFWADLQEDPAFAGGAAADLALTLRLGTVFGNYMPALKEVRRMRQKGAITSLRDLARLRDDDWDQFLERINSKPSVAPDVSKIFVAGARAKLRSLHPTEPLRAAARRQRDPISTRWVSALLAVNPQLDPRQPLPDDVNWGDVAEANRATATADWSAFRSEALTFRQIPAAVLLDATERNNGRNPVRDAANTILDSGDLDLVTEQIDGYLQRNPNVLASIEPPLRAAAVDHLKANQRILRVVAEPSAVEPLLADGLDSAFRITRVPISRFVARYGELFGGTDVARRVYRKAQKRASTAQLVLSTAAQSVIDISPWAVRGGDPKSRPSRDAGRLLEMLRDSSGAPADSATWPALFGETTWCACDHCQSVYSPAAYFVDLLHMLDQHERGKPNPLTELFIRRPDLPYLKLSCENTNTTLPYIDLANEVLETYLAAHFLVKTKGPGIKTTPFSTMFSYDTGTLTAAELRAAPQHVRTDVYDQLATEVYPFTLPFHRPLAVVRTYLAQLGTSYSELIEAIPVSATRDAHTKTSIPADQRLAAEFLGLSTFEFLLIADATRTVSLEQCYGFSTETPQWMSTVSDVPQLLSRTGLNYEDLVAVVKTFFVNPFQYDSARRIELEAPLDCKLAGTRVLRATEDTWSRLHRFVRLWRATGWSIGDLDRALFAVTDDNVLDRDAVVRLATVKRIQQELDLPLNSILALWSDLDTWGTDALYLAQFQNRTVMRLYDTGVDPFALAYVNATNSGVDPEPDLKPQTGQFSLVSSNEPLANQIPAILAALRITESDLVHIWDHAISLNAIGQRDTASVTAGVVQALDLHSLTVLYRYTVLARGLGMRITDLVGLLTQSGADPFMPRRPAATLDFVKLARRVQASGMSVVTLDYLFRHIVSPAQGPAPADTVVLCALTQIWAALGTVRQDTAVIDDPDASLLATRLAMVHPLDVVSLIIQALDPAGGLNKARRDQIVTDYLRPYVGTALSELLAPDPVPTAGRDQSEVDAERRLVNQQIVLEGLSAWLRDSLGRSAVVSVVAATLGLPDAVARRLLVDWIPSDRGWEPGNPHPAIDEMLRLSGGGLTARYFRSGGFAQPEAPTISTPNLTITAVDPRRGARWRGRLLPLGEGSHIFVMRTDGAAQLRIEGQTVAEATAVDDGIGRIDQTATVSLTAGKLVEIEVSFDAGDRAGSIELLWRLETAQSPIPIRPENLFPASAPSALDAPGAGPGHTWRRLHKAALLIIGLGLNKEELDWIESDDTEMFAGFHLRDLPMQDVGSADLARSMQQWQRLADFAALRSSLPKAETTLASVLRSRAPAPNDPPTLQVAHWTAQLCDVTGWDQATVELLLRTPTTPINWEAPGATVLGQLLGWLVPGTDAAIGQRLSAIARLLELGRRIGVDPATFTSWVQDEPTAQIADEVVRAVRGRYPDDADWFEVARTQNDILREAQRDALVAYLMPRMQIDNRAPLDADELFEYFLIDVQTASCSETSRIKQAISSVQLFVQRILLGLEKPIEPDVIDAETWPWNKNYRVWEANRKIFLYPENWIEPELRDGKSPFFEDLESELMQAPLDDVHVEDAFLAYLDKLDQVARLEVAGVYWQREPEDTGEDIDILHVVARTPGTPTLFFYRSLVDGCDWTPWEKIDLDIETEPGTGNVHLVLTVHDRRLYLFWATFLEQPKAEQQGNTEGQSPLPPLTNWKIRLAWSTYRDGRWSAKQVSSESVTSSRFIDENQQSLYKDEVKDFEDDVDSFKEAKEEAADNVKDAERDLWEDLGRLRNQLIDRIKDSWEYKLVDDFLYDQLAPLFYHEPANLVDLELWLSSVNKSFESFIDDIYEWPHYHCSNGPPPDFDEYWSQTGEFPKTLDPIHVAGKNASELKADYEQVLTYRDRLDEATANYEAMNRALQSFGSGTSDLAIPDARDRNDHTFWQSTAKGLEIDILRHPGNGDPLRVAKFSLSDDAREVTADNVTNTEKVTVSPEHSTARFNGFRLNSKRLSLLGLDLLEDASSTVFVAEHCFHKDVTGNNPRPFFLSKGSDCYVALLAPPPEFVLALPDSSSDGGWGGLEWQPSFRAPIYRFEPFNHPFVLSLIKRLNRHGIDGLLTLLSQNPSGADADDDIHFVKEYDPSWAVYPIYPPRDIDFRDQGAYALYNWELFFHAPFLIAIRLMQERRFEEARDWFHYIFDPTTDEDSDAEGTKRFWRVKPFSDYEANKRIRDLLTALAAPDGSAALKDDVKAQIDRWHLYPASPHRIAAIRLSAYQKAVVMRYLDNLIAWGDSLFMSDTIESINEATQLYILASHLLGPRPERIPPQTRLEPLDFHTIQTKLDDMSNLVVDVENLLFPFGGLSTTTKSPSTKPARGSKTVALKAEKAEVASDTTAKSRAQAAFTQGISHIPALRESGKLQVKTDEAGKPTQVLYFCVPDNDKLLGYWDTVDDRLFKIRHCMNIEGVERQLPLFEPPIDPALLVRAAAAGLDLASVLSDLGAPRGNHRFPVLLQKANELCGEVRSLGGLLLAALEKRDGEALALLRATHEKLLLKAVKDVRAHQLAEAEAAKTALERTRETVDTRFVYYSTREKTNTWEELQLVGMGVAGAAQLLGSVLSIAASGAAYIPDFDWGPTGMGVHGTTKFGGSNISAGIKAQGEAFSLISHAGNTAASMAGIMGSHQRRMDDWEHQANLASKELLQIDKQLVAADIRIAIAKQELSNQELQIENSSKVEEVLRTKYTNDELYSWMISKISEVYYQAYKLAYDMARRAERGYCYETGVATSSFIQFGYWDGLRKGLLAGEQLALDLKRLDAAYLEASRRELEITRQISLVLHNPAAFIALRDTGSCTFDLPEEMFDADYPGHYFRRLKTVSLTLPCVAGPYTAINCTLTQLSSRVRVKSSAALKYPEQDSPNDSRFQHEFGSIQSIATSHGQNDAGMFEVNFRDDRYLPFEGTGAISRWRIDLPKDCNAFDFDTLSDVVMKVSYTARDGGKPLATAARDALATWRKKTPEGESPSLQRLFRVRYEMADDWFMFRTGLTTSTNNVNLNLTLDRDRFPFVFRGAEKIQIEAVHVFAIASKAISSATSATITISPPVGDPSPTIVMTPQPAPSDPLMLHPDTVWRGQQEVAAAPWILTASSSSFPIDSIKDLLLLVTFTVSD